MLTYRQVKPFSYKENVMKKYILLLTSLIPCAAQAKTTHPTQSWNKQYGIKQLTSSDKNGLATGLYYLMKGKGNEKIIPFNVSQFYEIANNACGYQCRNAYQKVFDKTVVATHNKKNREQAWIENVLPYYTDVISKLSRDEKTIAFGVDQGKKLPETLFELDRMLNPRPVHVTTVLQVSMPRFSIYLQM